jgi:hypothetical protein
MPALAASATPALISPPWVSARKRVQRAAVHHKSDRDRAGSACTFDVIVDIAEREDGFFSVGQMKDDLFCALRLGPRGRRHRMLWPPLLPTTAEGGAACELAASRS